MKRTTHLIAAAALAALAGSPAAQAVALAPQSYGPVTVVSGGIGVDEAAAIKQMSSRYPLRVVMSRPDGHYRVAEWLAIARPGGSVVVEIEGAGPWVLADLPPGRYTLQATFGGHEQRRSVVVGRDGTTVHWVVPQPPG